ncbi:hypothetical protein PMAYCL1PPCAC_17808, partial [Pristionchus mayeri]
PIGRSTRRNDDLLRRLVQIIETIECPLMHNLSEVFILVQFSEIVDSLLHFLHNLSFRLGSRQNVIRADADLTCSQ